MLKLVRAGRAPAKLSPVFEQSTQSISRWLAQEVREESNRQAGKNLASSVYYPISARTEATAATIAATMPISFTIGYSAHLLSQSWIRCWRVVVNL